jgi:hypothetical protein
MDSRSEGRSGRLNGADGGAGAANRDLLAGRLQKASPDTRPACAEP